MFQGTDSDTIAAIATPHGESGIGIVRISGPEAKRIAEKIFQPKERRVVLKSHQIRHGEIVDPKEGRAVDEVLLTFMAAPRTYTREDVVEINCHGGYFVLQRVLEIVLREGAREALPGEFTKRAFLAGRIDLAQAEAVLDVIQAKTEEGLRSARQQLRGRLSQEVEGLHGELMEILVPIEAYIDFPEEDIVPPSMEWVKQGLHRTLAKVQGLIRAYDDGHVYRDGVKVAIVGKVNVGKSSLFNQLLDRRRTIVTGIPGTTTDVIEEVVTLSGVPIRLMDMAGLREPGDEVEQEGVRFAKEKLSEADLVLLVLDRSGPFNDEDRRIFREVEGRKAIVALNKIDLPAQLCEEEDIRKEVGINDIYPTSALTGDGIETLKRGLVDTIMKGKVPTEGGDFIPVNLRHKRVFERVREALEEVVEGLERGIPWDITAIEIKRVLGLLGEIVGETTPEAVLEAIFSQFCIGK